MSDFSQEIIARSGYERQGFPELYDRYRPSPPSSLLEILEIAALVERPRQVVDFGAGTGLSTRVWADRAEAVVGVEANTVMLAQARRATAAGNVRYVGAFAHDTGLAPSSADLVTCAQAFHWMDPGPVLAEAARLLRRGGVFAAYDYDVPPLVHPEVDDAFAVHFAARGEARRRLGLPAGAATWPKERHLERISHSRHFRFAREVVCHGVTETGASSIVGLAEAVGGPRGLFGAGAPEVGRTFAGLRDAAARSLGDKSWPMVISYRIRLGVK